MIPAADPRRVELHLGAQSLELRWHDAQGEAHAHTLPLGIEALRQRHRFTRPPQALALESVIESIEDAVMPWARVVPQGGMLMLDPRGVPEGLVDALGQPDFDIHAVEAAFDRLSNLALGRPAAQAGVPESPEFAIALLIVREAMHHLPLRQGRWQARP